MYKASYFFDFLLNAPYFIKLKRDPPRYKPVLDPIRGRTPNLPIYKRLFVKIIKIVIISIRIHAVTFRNFT
jgi:hypothetical protein